MLNWVLKTPLSFSVKILQSSCIHKSVNQIKKNCYFKKLLNCLTFSWDDLLPIWFNQMVWNKRRGVGANGKALVEFNFRPVFSFYTSSKHQKTRRSLEFVVHEWNLIWNVSKMKMILCVLNLHTPRKCQKTFSSLMFPGV